MLWLYEKIKKNQWVEVARSFSKQILDEKNWNVSQTSKILWCSRRTIRRARDWTSEDWSRKPKNLCKFKTKQDLEELILFERKTTKYWRIRLSNITMFLNIISSKYVSYSRRWKINSVL